MDKKYNIFLAVIGSFILVFMPHFSRTSISLFGGYVERFLEFLIQIISFIGLLLVSYFAFILIKPYFQKK